MTDEVHSLFTSSCLYYGGAGSLGENREPHRHNEVVYNIDQGGAEPHHPCARPAGAPARPPWPANPAGHTSLDSGAAPCVPPRSAAGLPSGLVIWRDACPAPLSYNICFHETLAHLALDVSNSTRGIWNEHS